MVIICKMPNFYWHSVSLENHSNIFRYNKFWFFKLSETSFQYSVQAERDTVVAGSWDAEDQFEAFRTVLLISADKFKQGVDKIKTELSTT